MDTQRGRIESSSSPSRAGSDLRLREGGFGPEEVDKEGPLRWRLTHCVFGPTVGTPRGVGVEGGQGPGDLSGDRNKRSKGTGSNVSEEGLIHVIDWSVHETGGRMRSEKV